MNFWKFEEGRNGAPISERTLARCNILKGRSRSGTRPPRVITILHSSAPIDLEHNVASQQTNVAIINTVSGQPSACFTQHLTPLPPPRPRPLVETAPDAQFIIITSKSPASSNKHQLRHRAPPHLLKDECFVTAAKWRWTVLNNARQKVMAGIF